MDYYAQRMGSGEVLSADELDTIRRDLDAMPQAVRAEMEADHGAGATRMAKAAASGMSEEFTLSAEELASIKPEPPTDHPPCPGPEFAPKL
ncbi:MAG: hypothetical protein ACJ8AH_06290 [Stellaceae bacterium]